MAVITNGWNTEHAVKHLYKIEDFLRREGLQDTALGASTVIQHMISLHNNLLAYEDTIEAIREELDKGRYP